MSKLLREILDMGQCPKNPVVTVYDRDDIKVGSTSNDIEFAYIRLQIAENKIEGCYFVYDGKKYPIESTGEVHTWPYGCFDALTDVTGDLLQISIDENKKEERSNVIDLKECPYNEYVKIYDSEGKLICWTNDDLQYDWVRARIKEKKLKGCYLIFRGERIEINEYGCPLEYPKGMFDNHLEALCDLV